MRCVCNGCLRQATLAVLDDSIMAGLERRLTAMEKAAKDEKEEQLRQKQLAEEAAREAALASQIKKSVFNVFESSPDITPAQQVKPRGKAPAPPTAASTEAQAGKPSAPLRPEGYIPPPPASMMQLVRGFAF